MNVEILQSAIQKSSSLRGAARLLGVSFTTIRYWVKKLRIQTRPKKINGADWVLNDPKLLAEFKKAAEKSETLAGCLRLCGHTVNRAGYYLAKKVCLVAKIDTSHWLGKYYVSRGKSKAIPLEEVLTENSRHNVATRKKKLIKLGLLENKCYECGSPPVWREKRLVLILDHINGDNTDNRIKNIRLLCPNCNSQMPTFCGRNKFRKLKSEALVA